MALVLTMAPPTLELAPIRPFGFYRRPKSLRERMAPARLIRFGLLRVLAAVLRLRLRSRLVLGFAFLPDLRSVILLIRGRNGRVRLGRLLTRRDELFSVGTFRHDIAVLVVVDLFGLASAHAMGRALVKLGRSMSYVGATAHASHVSVSARCPRQPGKDDVVSGQIQRARTL